MSAMERYRIGRLPPVGSGHRGSEYSACPASRAARPYPEQEGQGHPQEYADHHGDGHDRNVKKEGTDTPQEKQSNQGD